MSAPVETIDDTTRRRSARMASRRAKTRQRILQAAQRIVAEQGFAAAQMSVVAEAADVATGTIYLHFSSKSSLFAEMLRAVCTRELEVVRDKADESAPNALERIGNAVAVFVDRALRGEGLAYSVIAEPMDSDVDQVRLEARAELAEVFASIIDKGIKSGEFADQDAPIRGAAIVGAFLEGVVSPLAERRTHAADRAAIAAEIARFCQTAVAGPQSKDPR